MRDYGKVECIVELGDELPFFKRENKITHFEATAKQWDRILSSCKYFSPMLVEHLKDETGAMEVIYPEKRKQYVHNFLDLSGYAGAPPIEFGNEYIMWTPIQFYDYSGDDNLGIIKDIQAKFIYKSFYIPDTDICNYSDGTDSGCDKETAAYWSNTESEAQGYPDDKSKIEENVQFLQEILDNLDPLVTYEPPEFFNILPNLGYVYQSKALDGLFYCVESEIFLSENMPFWLNLKRTLASPTGWNYETLMVISLGFSDGGTDGNSCPQEYDLILRNNAKPELVDYWFGRNGQNAYFKNTISASISDSEEGAKIPKYNRKTFDVDLSRVLREEKNIELGFMTVGGRLCIFVNNVPLVYTRLNPYTGNNAEAKISPEKIRVYGTNCPLAINVSAMSFAQLGAFPVILPSLKEANGDQGQKEDGEESSYQYMDTEAKFSTQPLVILPTEVTAEFQPQYGVDCAKYSDANGQLGPTQGFGFHKNGNCVFYKSGYLQLQYGDNAGIDAYIVGLQPKELSTGKDGWYVTNGGAPYFFRLRGSAPKMKDPNIGFVDISEDVISISQNDSLENDFTALVKKVDVSLYNKGGKYDNLRDGQKVIRVSWGWCGENANTTFTGLTISSSVVETPGNEIINVHCEDTTWMLKQIPIINCPYFDGIFSYAAIEVLIKMAGATAYDLDWPDKDIHFITSGQGINDIRVRYESAKSIFDCIVNMAERDQSHFWYDGDGKFHLRRIPGGLFFDAGRGAPAANFVRDPDNNNANTFVILNEKNVEYSLNSVVNKITIVSTARDNTGPLIHNLDANGGQFNPAPDPNTLLFDKCAYVYESAFGDYPSCVLYAIRMGERMFYPILKTSFTVVGLDGQVNLEPLAFVLVDGDGYRVTSVQRKYSADSNDYTLEISCEWLYGRQPGR